MTRLILIRHGETDWNRAGRYSGQTDVPLNAEGRAQAQRVADSLGSEVLSAIYSSDLSRARVTAESIAAATGAPLVIDPRLREIDQGEWEGMPFEQIRTRFQEAWRLRQADPLTVAPPGGETVGEIRARVLEAVEEMLQEFPSGTVALVSHGLALAIIKVHYQGLPILNVWQHIPANARPEFIELEPP